MIPPIAPGGKPLDLVGRAPGTYGCGKREGTVMKSASSFLVMAASVLLLGAGPSLAGIGAPAPLVGVTGPVGIVAAGVAYGGYLLYKRFRDHR
jgi:hypothetical protein